MGPRNRLRSDLHCKKKGMVLYSMDVFGYIIQHYLHYFIALRISDFSTLLGNTAKMDFTIFHNKDYELTLGASGRTVVTAGLVDLGLSASRKITNNIDNKMDFLMNTSTDKIIIFFCTYK